MADLGTQTHILGRVGILVFARLGLKFGAQNFKILSNISNYYYYIVCLGK